MTKEPQKLETRQELSDVDRPVDTYHAQQLMDPAIEEIKTKVENQQGPAPKKKTNKPKKRPKPGSADKQTAPDAPEGDTRELQKERKAAQIKNRPILATNRRKKEEYQGKKKESEDSDEDLGVALTPPILKELEEENIFPLENKSARFPRAKYFCRLCEYYLENVRFCREHYDESRHKRRLEIAAQERILRDLPQPSKRHLERLDKILLDINLQYGLSDQDLQQRTGITRSIQNFLSQSIPGIELRVYGSSLPGFGLESSDLNINLVVPDGDNPANLLRRVYTLLVTCDTYKNVRSNFLAKVPSVLFESPCETVHCEISVNSDLAYYTSQLLAIYSRINSRVRQLAAIFRHWAKICQIDDQQKGSLPSYTFGLMTVFFLQQCTPPLLPVLWKDIPEEVRNSPNDILKMLKDLDRERQEWVCENDTSIGQLWINLLLFYGVNFNISEHVISIRQKETLLQTEKGWKTGRLSIEDPFSSKRNIAQTLFYIKIFDYVCNCLRKGCLYFSLSTNHRHIGVDHVQSGGKIHHQTQRREEPDSVMKKKLERPRSPDKPEYNFNFTVDVLTDGKCPSIICGICETKGHIISNCPEDKFPEVKRLPPVTKRHLILLSAVVKTAREDFQLSPREVYEREKIRWTLECFIQELYPDAELSLFGSSKNGFGCHLSDLDICMTLRGKDPEDLNFVELMEALSKKLKTHKSFYNVFPIITAKVPIVKFVHRPTQLEGDAQQNSRLLYCYSRIDPRVVILGYAIKVFAKVCDIGDASKGSLSSYAYMLLLLHYLQHTKPPVIPVLQQLSDGDERAKFMVDGWNAGFYSNMSNLPRVWPGYGRNKQSVGELWLGLFKYYVEEFNVEEDVVTIRQFEPLTKFEKLWNGKRIAIEDPFELSHNLGAGLTREMHKYIMSTLFNARELYGSSITGTPDGYYSLIDYFFDTELLTEGDVPNARLCRVCGKIGHIQKECPRVLAKKERKER